MRAEQTDFQNAFAIQQNEFDRTMQLLDIVDRGRREEQRRHERLEDIARGEERIKEEREFRVEEREEERRIRKEERLQDFLIEERRIQKRTDRANYQTVYNTVLSGKLDFDA